MIVKYSLQMMASVGDKRRALHPATCYTVGQHSAVSVAVLASESNNLHFIDVGVKIKVLYCSEVLLMQKLLPIINVFSYYFIFNKIQCCL